jgi:hypothetical protein
MLRGCTYGAANAVAAYNGGGKSDWHLPSKDELDQLYLRRATVGGFEAYAYWSSSEYDVAGWEIASLVRYFNTGNSFASNKANTTYVRPVRAF